MRLAIVISALLLLPSCGRDAAETVEGRAGTIHTQAPSDEELRSESEARPESRAFDPVRFVFDRDLFPVLTDPDVVRAQDVAHGLAPRDEVIGVRYGGRVRAYPVRVIQLYHAVNDMLGERPLLLTFCVVCSSGTVWDPVHRGRRLTFGFEGIHAGRPVYYDHQTKTRWFHMTGEAFNGWHAGARLNPITSVRHTTWGEWSAAHPNTEVLLMPASASEEIAQAPVGHRGEDFMPRLMRPTLPKPDERLQPNELLFGVQEGRFARAYPLRAIRSAGGVLHDRIGKREISIWLAPGGETAVAYDARVGTTALRFEWDHEGSLRDLDSQSVWSLDGECVDGPLFGARLAAIHGHMTEWYGWHSTYPRTLLRK